LSAVMAAKLAGCGTIIATDVHDERLVLARELGATHAFNPRTVDVVAEIRRITGGGAAYALEASGLAAVGQQAVTALMPGGQLAYVSAFPSLAGVDAAHAHSITIAGVVEGDSIPQVFIPKLIDYYRAGQFPFDRLIKFYPWPEINQAVAEAENGAVIKPVLVMA